jgi:hypothetical protein
MLQSDEAVYTPHAGQARLHQARRDGVRSIWARVARRWGKSRFALWDLLDCYQAALSIPVSKAIVPPFHAWIVVPSFPQARQTWNELLQFIPEHLIQEGGVHHDGMFIYLRGSANRSWGQVEVKSAHDPDNLQSVGLDYLWIQEAQDVSDRAYEKILPTLRTPERMRMSIFEGIPSTYSEHWFQKGYRAIERDGDAHATSTGTLWKRDKQVAFTATVYQNPLLPPELLQEVEDDRERLPVRVWNRMYLAEFGEGGGFFSNVEQCVAGDLMDAPVGGRYVAGIDLGRRMDATVIHVYDAARRQLVFHRRFDESISWPRQREVTAHILNEWGISRTIVDGTGMGGDMFVQELEGMGVSVEAVDIHGGNRQPMLDLVAVALERETVHYPPIPTLLRELRAFQYRKLPSGRWRAEAPPGEHDDEVFAMALGLQACDDAAPVAGFTKLASRRYIMTATDLANGSNSKGIKAMKARLTEKMRERAQRAGVL